MKNKYKIILVGIILSIISFGVSQYVMYECTTMPIFMETPYNPTLWKCLEIWENQSLQSEQKIGETGKLPEIPPHNLENIHVMEPDSVRIFYYPNPEETENRDAFETYMLIRLPDWLGGAANDLSAYRAYSAKSVDDPCLVKYWGGDDRQRIENPCRGGFYRVHDGVLTFVFGSVPNTHPVALPHLDLSVNQKGFLYVEPPSFSKTENGVISYGRDVSLPEITKGSQFYIDSFANYFPEFPKFPLHFGGLQLADIASFYNGGRALYSDFGPISNTIEMKITKCNCDKTSAHYSYQTTYAINGIDVVYHDRKSQHPQSSDTHNKYFFKFAKDGFEFSIEGKDFDEIKKSIQSILLKDLSLKFKKTSCEEFGGTWISESDECENISLLQCNQISGMYSEESPCRHDDNPENCFAAAVSVCKEKQ